MENFSHLLEGQPFIFVILVVVIVGQYLFFTRFIKSLKDEHHQEMIAKDKSIENLHSKFLMFQTKFIEILTKLNSSLEMSQNNDLQGQQQMKEVRHEIQTSTNEIKLLFEKILLKLE